MADNSKGWGDYAARIARNSSSAAPTYKAPPPTQQRQTVQAQVNRLRAAPPPKTGKT